MVVVINLRRNDLVRNIRELAALTGQSLTDTVAKVVRGELDRLRANDEPRQPAEGVDGA